METTLSNEGTQLLDSVTPKLDLSLRDESKQKFPLRIKISFCLFGISCFVTLFMIFASSVAFHAYVFPGRDFSLLSSTVFSTGLFLANCVFTLFPKLDPPRTMRISFAGLGAISALLLLIVTTMKSTAIGFYTALALLFVHFWFYTASLTTTFAFASILSPSLTAIVGLGVGLAGILPLIFGVVLEKAAEGTMIMVFFAVSTFFCIIGFLLISMVLKSPEVTRKLRDLHTTHSTTNSVDIESGKEELLTGRLTFLYKLVPVTCGALLSMGSLYSVYPTLSTFMRPERQFAPVMVGFHSVGELIGRTLAVSGISVSRRFLVPVGLLRFGFIPLFREVYNFPLDHWARAEFVLYGLQMFQGISFGILISSCFIEAANSMETAKEKQMAGYFTTIANNFGVPLGMMIFNILVLANYIPKSLLFNVSL